MAKTSMPYPVRGGADQKASARNLNSLPPCICLQTHDFLSKERKGVGRQQKWKVGSGVHPHCFCRLPAPVILHFPTNFICSLPQRIPLGLAPLSQNALRTLSCSPTILQERWPEWCAYGMGGGKHFSAHLPNLAAVWNLYPCQNGTWCGRGRGRERELRLSVNSAPGQSKGWANHCALLVTWLHQERGLGLG